MAAVFVAAHDAGCLQFFGERHAFTAYLAPLRRSECVVYNKRPFGGPRPNHSLVARRGERIMKLEDQSPQEWTRMGRARSLCSLLGRGPLRHTHVHSHPRLLGAGVVAILLYFLLSGRAGTATRFLIAFDGGALIFLVAVWVMMARASPDGMRRRAEREDEGRVRGSGPQRHGRNCDFAHNCVRAARRQKYALGRGRFPRRVGGRDYIFCPGSS
jgi:hypothetical protein